MMDRAELVTAINKDAGFAEPIIDAVLGYAMYHIAMTITKGERVQLRGFGAFHSAKRAARPGRNPRTGKKMMVPATTVAKFVPGLALKISVAAKNDKNKGMQKPWRVLSIEK